MICYLFYFSKNTQLFGNRWLAKFKVVRKQNKEISLKNKLETLKHQLLFYFILLKE